ncbi:MAG: hypothetical protein ABSC42_16510 [Tepidisphaeraceae bacterium]|jgi:hypothetical protein
MKVIKLQWAIQDSYISQKRPEKPIDPHQGGAESGAVLPPVPGPVPPALMETIGHWSLLPFHAQAAILAIIRALS